MLRKMPVILLIEIIIIMLLEPTLPLDLKSMIYALSLTIKSLIMFLLPFLIFGLLFKVSAGLAQRASTIILFVLASICISNFISTLVSYGVASGVYEFDLSLLMPGDLKELHPYWTFGLPKLIANDKAMFMGLISGVAISFFKPSWGEWISQHLEKVVSKILSSFAMLIPLFVAGFTVKLQYEGILTRIVQDYALIFVVIALAQYTYILLMYGLVNQFKFKKFISTVQNMLPAALAGFSTMSSVAAMPLTILAVEKNSADPDLSKSVVPATVNVHLIGDCFAIPIFAFAVLKNFGVEEPLFVSYLIFAFYFVLAKFSVSAVPGGGILVMLPVLETHLGFSGEMMSLITALYILFDPVITSANVLGNGGLSMVLGKISATFKERKLGFAKT
jgi:hypothetical protein